MKPPPIASGTARGDQIEAEQTRALYRNCPFGVISAALVAVMLANTLHGATSLATSRAYLWSALVAICAIAHLLLCALFHRRFQRFEHWRHWANAFTLIVLFEGMVWCLGTVVFLSDADVTRALVVLLAWAGIVSAAIVVFGAFMRTYLIFIFPSMVPHFLFLAHHPYPFSGAVITLLIIYMFVMPVIVYRLRVQVVNGHRLRFENLDLAEEMKDAKERADQASLAKSRFLAAASHDLRQPVHALGLFIGALRDRTMDEEARRLVDHIDGSVAAMDDLFTSLLDISKLDAGVVRPSFGPVAVGSLIVRLCQDYAGEAAAKGIALRWVKCELLVSSDPVLLERILRNLISNAVRYTEVGGVVVGCRRHGRVVEVEVWDSGCGISASHHEQVFQEFFQVGNPERDRAQGLGLGLAIVKRLAALIAAPLALRSEPGRGSVFRLSLARLGDAIAVAAVPAGARDAPGALIVVIDDEIAIQQAMTSLLSSWHHRVVAAGSSQELILRHGDTLRMPDLIICDYRLRGGENGVEAIADLRDHFGCAVPALLVTGDTAPDRIVEAQASGFLLLHKPLSNARLRAAIGNMLRGVSASSQ